MNYGRASDLAVDRRRSRVPGDARGGAGPRRRLRPRPHPGQARHHPALWRPLAGSVLALAYLAGRTRRIRLGASVIVLLATPWWRPRRRPPSIKRQVAASSSASAWAGTRPSSWTCVAVPGARAAERRLHQSDQGGLGSRRAPAQGRVRELQRGDPCSAPPAASPSADLGRGRARWGLGTGGAALSWATPGIRWGSASPTSRRGFAAVRDLARQGAARGHRPGPP